MTKAGEIVDGALRGRELRRDDVIELRSIFSRVGAGPERDRLRAEIITAINDQKLTAQDPAFIVF